MKIASALSVLCMAGLGVVAPASAAPPADLVCDGRVESGIYNNVRVAKGKSCLLGSKVKVRGNVTARRALHLDVYTDIPGNLTVLNSKGSTFVHAEAWPFHDIEIGGDLMVADSHNVLLDEVDVDGDIDITGNDGWIVVRDTHSEGRILVSHNLKFVPDTHTTPPNRRPHIMRIRRVTACGKIRIDWNVQPAIVTRTREGVCNG